MAKTTGGGRANTAPQYSSNWLGFAFSVFLDGLREDTLRSPSVIDAVVKNVSRNSQNISPLRDGQCLPVMRESNITSFVVHLFFDSSPSAIIRRIRSSIVDAVQSAPLRGIPHILKEISKRLAPTGAHDNTAPAIAGVGFMSRIVATSKHCDVCPVQRVVRKSVLQASGEASFRTETTATLCVSGSQFVAANLSLIAAIAKTVPDGISVFYVRKGNDKQSTKTLTSQVLNAGRYFCGIMGLHREPPKFSVSRAGTLAASPAFLILSSVIIAQNIRFVLGVTGAGI